MVIPRGAFQSRTCHVAKPKINLKTKSIWCKLLINIGSIDTYISYWKLEQVLLSQPNIQ